ncbi:MAG: DUF7674 family protein [Gemmatimonadaceae bacterium]
MNGPALNQALIRRFPGLLDGYLEIKRLWGGDEPGAHVVYGDLLVPFIHGSLAAGRGEHELPQVMDFLEELSAMADDDVLDVVVTSVLEPLIDEEDRLRLESAMGPRTLRLWRRLVADVG